MATILLIEDNFEIRENTSEILELEGYEVLFASNGKEGIEIAKEEIPNLILCDIMMPGANGYEVIQELKKKPETSGIPFIFFTASAERSEMQTGLDMGAAAYIRKPFEEAELLQTINRCLNPVQTAI